MNKFNFKTIISTILSVASVTAIACTWWAVTDIQKTSKDLDTKKLLEFTVQEEKAKRGCEKYGMEYHRGYAACVGTVDTSRL